MTNLNEDDIDGLANRLALLAFGDGEADNAGRALGAMARRLGLTGGELKALFLDGARAGRVNVALLNARIAALEAEAEAMRETLRKAEILARALQSDRDALQEEVEELHGMLDQRRGARQTRRALGIAATVAVAVTAWLVLFGPRLHLSDDTVPTVDGTPQYRTAVIRDRLTPLRRTPDITAEVLANVPIGTRLPLHKLLWHGLQQWAEVELNGQTGYVLSTDVDLS